MAVTFNSLAMSEKPKLTPSMRGIEMAVFELDISGKDVAEIQNEKPLDEIRKLTASQNQIQSLAFLEHTPNLVDLDLSQNQISEGVSNFSLLKFIHSINLSSNLFENVNGFPTLNTLTYLDLSSNHLASAGDIPSLPFLKHLNLSNNSITALNLAVMPSLQILNLQGNLLAKLELPNLPSIREIDASHNSIETIDQFTEESLPYLWSLNLRYNQLKTPEELHSFEKLPLLFDLKIENNPLIQEDKSHIPPILVILPTLTILDGEQVNAKNKVKAELSVKSETML
ncbi:Leucine Rich Repeat family protein [Trichomonas vaginalis G3]|uniref:Leucine Rich Repeat family protein n=1 Tax=Trichomonas vaginalis (strain ATCC PRA-98 / G3) TaxID=412133 RepID=A2F3R9_TRIV3|nr:uncharacterized protein TVAGG3_1040070 [Trichomonas vaginalis G3]EAY00441.1 Leucine Rich Repeat family protein [Trichomonas vaginalis G3]KAI5493475.1 axoneme assembly [Trichomonas vaginalis G3]|eukprot:XP_001313370.1 hypothetical protein [Trichomonas vaginalis G3]